MRASRWLIRSADPEGAGNLAAELGIAPVTAQILLNRGYLDAGAARRFLDASLEALANAEAIIDVPAAVARLCGAVRRGEPVTVYGDYDADGVTATSLLVRGLRAVGAQAGWFIPSRFVEGYGLHPGALERIRAGGGGLVVAVDCGVTAVDEIAGARAAGQEIIVVDHHEPGPTLPQAVAVIDPKRTDAAGGFREYSAAGLALQLLRAVRTYLGHADLPEDLLALAALGTIADVVPLVGDNRILARAGLDRMTTDPPTGIAALCRVAGITGEVTARHVGFSLAPRLNAAGRLGDAGRAVRLLLTDDPAEADGIAATLDAENRARQQLCDQILTQAVEEVERRRLHEAPAIVLAGEGWHAGVIGIVASQLVERYSRPVVLMAVEGGVGKGSARSIAPFHMVDALAQSADLLSRFGGHAMAAGLTIAAERIPEFVARFTGAAAQRLRPDDLVPTIAVDAEVPLGAVTDTLARELRRLAPFGAGNPEPVLGARGLVAVSTRAMGDGLHLRLGVTDGEAYAEAVGFRLGDASELLAFTQARVDLAFSVSVDRWADRERVQLMVRDLVTPGVDLDAVLTDSRLLVDRLFARAEDYLGDGALGLEDAGVFNTKVVGVTFEGRQAVVRTLAPGDGLELRREPGNPVDPHAIRVLTGSGQQVGYLSARIAARLAPSMDSGARYAGTVSQITGGPAAGGTERSYGVNIVVQRADVSRDEGDPARATRAAWQVLDLDDLLERFRLHLRAGRALRPGQIEAIRAIDAGGAVLGLFGPGRGRMAVIVQAAAAHVMRRRGPVVIAVPLRGQAERVQAALAGPLARIGLHCLSAHGALMFRRRQHLLQALAAGAADVVVASVEYLRHAPPALRPSLVLLEADPAVDAGAWAEAIAHVGRPSWSVFAPGAATPGVAALQAQEPLHLLGDSAVRTNLRLVDRRAGGDRLQVAADAASRERTLVYVTGRRAAVDLAAALRAQGTAAAYFHGGLPVRVREVLTQTLADGRITALVAADGVREETVPHDLRQVIVAGLPPDRAELLEWIGSAGLDGRQATVTLLYGREDLAAAEAILAELHPSREVLAALFRAVRERAALPGGALWPDDGLAAALDGIAPSRRTVGIGLDVLAEAGVIQREFDGERWRIWLPEEGARRDLMASVRYTEGHREMQELAQLEALAFGPLPGILRAAAGGSERPEG